jgi:hypothetical protein
MSEPNSNNNNAGSTAAASTPGNTSGSSSSGATQQTTNTTSSSTTQTNTNNNRSNIRQPTASESKDFSGAMDKFDDILGMPYEQNLSNKKSMDDFYRNFVSHIECNTEDHSSVLSDFLTTGKDPKDIYKKPVSDQKESEMTAIEKWELQDEYKIYRSALDGDMRRAVEELYNKIWGQCTSALQGAISRRDDYESKKEKRDVLWLIKNLKEELSGVDGKANPYSLWWAAIRKLVNMRQKNDESASDFLKRQNEVLERFELVAGTGFFFSEKISKTKINIATAEEMNAEKEKFLGVHLVEQADATKCKDLWKTLSDGVNLGRDEYPKNRTAALNLLMKHTKEVKNLSDMTYDRANGAGRTQRGGGRSGGRGRGWKRWKERQWPPSFI